jgi:hypothetical protein
MSNAYIQYTLDDFKHIQYTGSINADTIEIINELSSLVGAPEYCKAPKFKQRVGYTSKHRGITEHNHTNNNNNNNNNNNWKDIRNFKTTALHKPTSDIDTQIGQLRLLLNKITDVTYDTIKTEIVVLLTYILKNNTNKSDIVRIGESIFDIGCLNKYWSHIYARLYKDLIEVFPVMKDVSHRNFKTFYSLFDTIEFVPSDENYDEFCRINKNNMKRRSISSFYIHLMNNNVVSPTQISGLIELLITKFMVYIHMDNKMDEVNEIGLNICIFIRECKDGDIFKTNETISSFIHSVLHMKPKQYKSLSRKIIFKFMDL